MKSVRCLFVCLLLPLSVFAREKFEFKDGDVVSSHLKNSGAAEPRQKYVPNLFANIAKVKPTVIFISYGMMESFNGEKALPQFINDYDEVLTKLEDMYRVGAQVAPANPLRIVLISPIRHEALGGAWVDPTKHNENLRAYSAAIKELAEKRGLDFVDLFDGMKGSHLTSNGVHLNSKGYVAAADAIEKQLNLGRGARVGHETEEQLRSAAKT